MMRGSITFKCSRSRCSSSAAKSWSPEVVVGRCRYFMRVCELSR